MCVQTIDTEEDCLYLNFLNNCGIDKAYPPLRMYETNDFVFINGEDGKQISISKVGFEVDINGTTYLVKDEAMAELAIQISCVNSSRTGDGTAQLDEMAEDLDKIVEQLSERGLLTYVDLTNSSLMPWVNFPHTVTSLAWTDGLTPQVIYPTAPTVVNNTTELAALWNATVLENKIEARTDTTIYISEGSVPVPQEPTAAIEIFTQAPLFLGYIRSASWGTEIDADPSSVNIIEEKVTQLADGGENLESDENGIATYNVPGNTAIVLVTEDNDRESVFVQVHSLSVWVRLKPAANVPNNREGYLVKPGGSINISSFSNGQKYFGEISLINAVDGEQPTYSLSVLKRP